MLRIADASLGDYYTQKEFKKLSEEQRAEYCAELARQDSVYKAEMLALREERDGALARSQKLRAEGDSLFSLGTAIESRITRGPDTPPSDSGRPDQDAGGETRHVVRRGESLWAISASIEGYGGGAGWPRIYEANRSRIKDPNLIYPGQELSIPR